MVTILSANKQLDFIWYFSGLVWKIYSGSKKSTRQAAAVFVLEKRALETQYPDKGDREAILEQCRKAVAQLTRLKHPQVLTVQVCLTCIYVGLFVEWKVLTAIPYTKSFAFLKNSSTPSRNHGTAWLLLQSRCMPVWPMSWVATIICLLQFHRTLETTKCLMLKLSTASFRYAFL